MFDSTFYTFGPDPLATTEQPPAPATLPVHATVTDADYVCPFNHNYFKKFPVVNGSEIVLTSRKSGGWFHYHTLDALGSGRPSGMVHVRGIELGGK